MASAQAERAAKKGVVCVALANSPEFVAAAAGGKAVFGTNPIAVGVPRGFLGEYSSASAERHARAAERR